MKLNKYPRPKNDTGIGFHYYLDTLHYGEKDLSRWTPELKEMGTSWLVLVADLPSLIPEFFIRELAAVEIEPIVHIRSQIKPLDQTVLYSQLRAYAAWGVHYIHVYNEPNLVGEWPATEWARPHLVERFMEMLWPCLEVMEQVGLCPLFTPLCPGGHYWDTTFLDTALTIINTKGKQHLYDRMAIGIHNYASNRPLDWGKGGRAKWSCAKPYSCPPGCQDQRGFHLFEWYDEIVRARVGHSLPLLCGENGLVVGTRNDPAFPIVDEKTHALRTLEMTKMLMDGELPDYVFNNAFWLLAQGERGAFENHVWYKSDGSQLPAVAALKALDKEPRRFSWDRRRRQVVKDESTAQKPIYHYLLLSSLDGESDRVVEAILPYLKRFAPTVGFSPEEARMASKVTIIGTMEAVPETVEIALRESGCEVERLECRNSREAGRLLGYLVRENRRFYYLQE
ncbi:MAG: hypothetical protein M1136_07605 [Chloroflexi bacterium]|nr:hypothetical protein [Chloroflexota bacterium]MCL5075500.1 hypothetical protein [Chloroflexota bacterium]